MMVESITSNHKHWELFILSEFMLEFFMIYVFVFSKNNSLSTETNIITTTIRTPKVYGNGQYGTSRWSSKTEFYKSSHTNMLKKSELDNIENIKFKKRRNNSWFRKT